MNFLETIKNNEIILTEGGMVERIRRSDQVTLDDHIAHAGLIYENPAKEIMTNIYKEYISVGLKHNFPFLTLAPTWRANPERIIKSKYSDKLEVLNRDCITYMKNIRAGFGDYSSKIFIGGMMACKNDAYKPEEALTETEAIHFHSTQTEQLSEAGVDFIKAATLPALTEALGIATAISNIDAPYIISFVVRPEGTLLDGIKLVDAINTIDDKVKNPPLFYMCNCVHPSVFEKTLENNPDVTNRLIGLQANTSAKSPEELESLSYLDTTDPEDFSDMMIKLQKKFKLKVLGGCCGSDNTHMEAIGKKL